MAKVSPPDRPPLEYQVFRGPNRVTDAFSGIVVAFGKFDGMHLGHRALLERAATASRRLGMPYGAVIFERHPDLYLRRGPVPPALTSLGEKLRLICDTGARFAVLLPADASVLSVPAERFVHDVLNTKMGVRLVVVSANFRFGHGGRGNVLTFRQLASAEGLDDVEVGMVEVAGGPVSATRIRASLRHGDVELAGKLLGRPYEIAGAIRPAGPASVSVAVPATRAVPSGGTYLGSFWARSHPKTVVIVEVGASGSHSGRLTVRGEGVRIASLHTGLGHVAFRGRL